MSTLIIVIGSSDIQLDSDKVTREKGRTEKQRSDKAWRDWYDDIKPDCYDISFLPKTAFPDIEEPYRIPLRVLGTVYQENPVKVQDEILSYLTVSDLVKGCQEYDKIIVILTDQSSAYTEEDRRRIRCPYWDDTSMCRPILEKIIGEKVVFAVKNSQQPLDTIQEVQEYLNTRPLAKFLKAPLKKGGWGGRNIYFARGLLLIYPKKRVSQSEYQHRRFLLAPWLSSTGLRRSTYRKKTTTKLVVVFFCFKLTQPIFKKLAEPIFKFRSS